MRHKGFTLVEIVLVVAVIFILAAIGAWRLSALKSEAANVAANHAFDVVQRMQQMSDLEGLTQTATTALDRIQEMQSQLSTKGHNYYQYNPTNLVEKVDYDATNGQWTPRTTP